MKTTLARIFIAAALLLSITWTGCKTDEPLDFDFTILKYDGNNFTAPPLAAGTYEAAVRFPAAQIMALNEPELTEVEFYLFGIPQTCEVIIYEGSNGDAPLTPNVHTRNLTAGRVAGAWNKYILNTPLKLKGEDLWVAVRFSHPDNRQVIGCDAGPAQNNGDWFWQNSDMTWKTYRERNPLDPSGINWNIRVTLREPKS